MNKITILSNSVNYGSERPLNMIKYLIIHATSNDGDSAIGNGNYFASRNVGASAHAFIDDNNVVISVPDNRVAWAVGGNKWTDCSSTGGGTMYGKITNYNSYSIELCDTNRNGVYDFSEATLNNAVEYSKEIMKKYNIPIDNVYRHFDVNGKHCPIQWFGNNEAWYSFKERLVQSEPKQEIVVEKGDFDDMTKEQKEKYINDLYIKNLGRIADNDGLNHWVESLDTEKNLVDFEYRFSQNEECRKYTVACAYRNLLKREGTEQDIKYWTQWLKGKTSLDLYKTFIKTDEYKSIQEKKINHNVSR